MERNVLCIFEDGEGTHFLAFTSRDEPTLERFNGYFIGSTNTPDELEKEMVEFFYQSSRARELSLAELRDFRPDSIYYMGELP